MKFALFNVPTSGHVNPTLPLAAELVRRGHEVVYYLTAAYREHVEATGATYRAYHAISHGDVADGYLQEQFARASERYNPLWLATMLVESAHRLLPSITRDLREDPPDAVLYDSMCPWGRLAAQATGFPAICSMSLIEAPRIFKYILKGRVASKVVRLFIRTAPELPRYWLAARRLSQAYGLSVAPFPRVLNWPGDRTICYTSREIQPGAGRYGDDYLFVGPSIASRPETVPFTFDQLDGQRPLIYISLGTVFNENAAFYRNAIGAFSNSPYQVILSTGGRISPDALGPLPPQILARPYVPQLEILRRAALFITHGGVNSVNEGLYYGVPLLLVPQQLEQAMVAARIAELGAGRLLQPEEATAGRLQALARRLLETPAYRSRAADLGAGLEAAGGAPRAADALEGWLHHGDTGTVQETKHG